MNQLLRNRTWLCSDMTSWCFSTWRWSEIRRSWERGYLKLSTLSTWWVSEFLFLGKFHDTSSVLIIFSLWIICFVTFQPFCSFSCNVCVCSDSPKLVHITYSAFLYRMNSVDCSFLMVWCCLQAYKPLRTFIALVGLEIWSNRDLISVTPPAGANLDAFMKWRNSELVKRKKHDNAHLIRYEQSVLIRPNNLKSKNLK